MHDAENTFIDLFQEELTRKEDIHRALKIYLNKIGIALFLYQAHLVGADGQRRDLVMTTFPQDWRSRYIEREYEQLDPTVNHALNKVSPLIWHKGMYVTAEQLAFREEALSFGISEGVTLPIHGHLGETAFLSLVADDISGNAQRQNQLCSSGFLLLAFVHEAVRRNHYRQQTQSVRLTLREQDCLRWVARGKSTWDISTILGISEHTVVFNMRNIMKKLCVNSRHLAVIRAISLGLIWLL